MDKVYLQMFSFGEFDPALTKDQICAAADMGYAGVELFATNFEMPVEEMKALLKEKIWTLFPCTPILARSWKWFLTPGPLA